MQTAGPRLHEPPGTLVLDRYRLADRLGSGGFGTVWAARDERLGREVAVKLVPIAPGAAQHAGRRAEREALAAARLAHPGIVALYEAGRDGERYALVSELVRGPTLATLLAHGALSDRDVLQMGTVLAGALAHAHARGVIHRDVKPSNVLCPDQVSEGDGVAKLTDFGVAHLAGGDALTRTGDVVGTLAYMAPEQAWGHAPGPPADVWALAIVLYEALAGVNPVGAGNAAAIARNLTYRVPSLGHARHDLPPPLTDAIDAALIHDPGERAGLRELGEELAAAAPHADDVPGLIADPASPEAGRGERHGDSRGWPAEGRALSGRARPWPRRARREPRHDPAGGAPARPPAPAPDHPPAPAPDPGLEARRRPTGPLARSAAALGAGVLVAVLLAWLGPSPPFAPASAALGAAAAVFLLPRLAWLAAVAGLVLWIGAALPGVALVVGLAVAPVPLLLPRAGAWWSAPALAPALGWAGVAVIFPALAGQASTVVRRATLGALGAWWLALAEALGGRTLLLGAPADLPPRAAWELSAFEAARTAVPALATAELAALAGLFALAAALLPVVVRGRVAALDLLGAGIWAAALAATIGALAPDASPPGLVGGAVLGATVAVGARAVVARR